MRVLVTGSNGLLGQKLVPLLASEPGYEVIATSKGPCRLPDTCGFKYVSLDITKPAVIDQVFRDTRPEAIVNTAAMTNVDQCEEEKAGCTELNVTAVSNLVEAASAYDSFLLHLSTDFIFDGLNGPYGEDAEPNPISYYGRSKLEGERLVSQSSLPWAIVRTVLVYGITHKMSRSNLVLWVKRCLENEETIQVVNDQWRTPTLAEDLAEGCRLILEKRAQGIFNISGKDLLTPYEMAIKTARFFELDASFIKETDSSKFTQTAKRPPKTGFDISKARQDLGYEPRSFDQGIAILAQQIKDGV